MNATNSIKSLLEERKNQTLERLEQVSQRITSLANKLETDKAIVLQRIEEKGEELNALLFDFKVVHLFV